jgi:hypothetical protein
MAARAKLSNITTRIPWLTEVLPVSFTWLFIPPSHISHHLHFKTPSSYKIISFLVGMDQFDRDSTIADFKNNTIKLMVRCLLWVFFISLLCVYVYLDR